MDETARQFCNGEGGEKKQNTGLSFLKDQP